MSFTRILGTGLVSALILASLGGDASAQRRRRPAQCAAGQHDSAGHCCYDNQEWVEARNACVCLVAGAHDSAGHCCGEGEEWVEARAQCVCLTPGRCRSLPATQPASQPADTQPAATPASQPAATPVATPAPTPAPQPEDTTQYTCPEGTTLVRGQTFMMGSVPGVGDADEQPAHRVTVGAYCIDRTEVTVAQYRGCMQAGTCSLHTTVNLPGLSAQDQQFFNQYCNGGRSDRDNHPINCVDWSQADAFCRSRNGRLPTEAEWELAARGADQRLYPWGQNNPTRHLLNGCDADCLSLFERPGRPRGRALHDSTDGFATTAPVGTFAAGNSLFGLSDMAGNVMEWVSDWYGPYTNLPVTDPRGPSQATNRVARGGHWYSSNPATVRGADRVEALPATRLATLGFRCVVAPTVPPPPAVEPAATPAPAEAPPEAGRRRRRRGE